jgi:hypothetical protein
MMARNYKQELATEKKNHPERGQERSDRNKARALVREQVGAAALKGKEVDHKRGVVTGKPKLNDLRIVTPKQTNHGRRGGPAKVGRK